MLTIKHIDESGNERIISGFSFVKERRSDGFAQYLLYPENPMPCEYVATWCGDDRSGSESLVNWQKLYVMNRFGATVAVHSFLQPNFGVGANADPELVSAAREQIAA